MVVNPHHLKKDELIIFLTGRCRHRNLYYKEPACFEKEILNNNKKLRIGILDIEIFGLNFNADGGIVLTYYIKEHDKNIFYHGHIDYNDFITKLDKPIIKNLINDLKKFNVIISFYGDYFDLPFIRTRSVIHGLNFIQYGDIKSIDLYRTMKHKFKLHSNSLKNACKVFGIDGKTEIDFYTWIRAIAGDKKALNDIIEHNRHDVIITDKLYNKIIQYERKLNRSI